MKESNVSLRHIITSEQLEQLKQIIGSHIQGIFWTSTSSVHDHESGYTVTANNYHSASRSKEAHMLFYIRTPKEMISMLSWIVSFKIDMTGVFGYAKAYLGQSKFSSRKLRTITTDSQQFKSSLSIGGIVAKIEFYGIQQEGVREDSIIAKGQQDKGYQDIRINYEIDIIYSIFIYLDSGKMLAISADERGGQSVTVVYPEKISDYLDTINKATNVFGEKVYHLKHTLE